MISPAGAFRWWTKSEGVRDKNGETLGVARI